MGSAAVVRSCGRIPRHTALNGIVYSALATSNVPATLESRGLCCGDGKRLNGIYDYYSLG